MGLRSYRGPITTMHHVLMAHGAVIIRCLECGHSTRRSAYRLHQRNGDIWKLPLEKPVSGFRCTGCGRVGQVTLCHAGY